MKTRPSGSLKEIDELVDTLARKERPAGVNFRRTQPLRESMSRIGQSVLDLVSITPMVRIAAS